MNRPTPFLLLFLLSLLAAPRLADARDLVVGLAVPLDGSFAPLGTQVREGFAVWQQASGEEFADLVEGEDKCDARSGEESAASFIEAGVDIVVGYLCAESLAAALPPLSAAGIPVMTLTVRADILGEEAARHDWRFFRLAPRASEEAEVAADQIVAIWADRPFALIEDGTILGRELVEAVRIALEERGLKPNFIDNYRPGQDRQPSLVRRLDAADVTRVFVGGERRDVAIIARDAKAEGLDLRFMGGDALNAAKGEVPLPNGTLAILSTAALPGIAPPRVSAAFAEAGLTIEGLRLPAFVAAQILGTTQTRLNVSESDIETILKNTRFETAIGPVSFDENGERREPGFTLAVWRDGQFRRTSPREVLSAEGESN